MKRHFYTIKLTEKQLDAVTTALNEWGQVEGYAVSGAAHKRYFDQVRHSIDLQHTKQVFARPLDKWGRFAVLALVLLLSACGKETSCRILPVAGTEKPVSGTSCPYGQVVTGFSGSVLTCAEVSVLCPTK